MMRIKKGLLIIDIQMVTRLKFVENLIIIDNLLIYFWGL